MTPDPVPPARRDEGEIQASSACPICSRDTPHSEEHHRVENEILMTPAMGDANATWLRPARTSPELSLPSLLARMVDRLIDEVVRLRAAESAAFARGRAEGIQRAAKLCNIRSCSWSEADDARSQDYREGIEDAATQLRDAIRALLGGADGGNQ